MLIRKYILPKRPIDWLCFALIGICLPLVYIVDISIILPAIHETGTFWYRFTLCIAIFLIFNIKGNFVACLLIDTSIYFNALIVPQNAIQLGWHNCRECHRLVPPRTWHCSICRSWLLHWSSKSSILYIIYYIFFYWFHVFSFIQFLVFMGYKC